PWFHRSMALLHRRLPESARICGSAEHMLVLWQAPAAGTRPRGLPRAAREPYAVPHWQADAPRGAAAPRRAAGATEAARRGPQVTGVRGKVTRGQAGHHWAAW